jgi:hypothetical protein
VRGRSALRTVWREVWRLADIEVSSVTTVVCDC